MMMLKHKDEDDAKDKVVMIHNKSNKIIFI